MLFFIVHLLFYEKLSKKEESGFTFYDSIIGIDIDGVLNKHESHFCEYYNKVYSKEICPEQITEIPVHYCDIGVSEEDERVIFETKDYWVTMPIREDAVKGLEKLKKEFGYKLYIFSWRPWGKSMKWDISRVTKDWLSQHRFVYDKLIIEKGSLYYPIKYKAAVYNNRFFWCKKKKIKYFIEDDLDKAITLSNMCKAVFLINHNYNQSGRLPSNVIRVESWIDIVKLIKKFG